MLKHAEGLSQVSSPAAETRYLKEVMNVNGELKVKRELRGAKDIKEEEVLRREAAVLVCSLKG